jgi:hypothetical protein
MKHVYCPNFFNPSSLTYQEVRQMSIQIPNPKKKEMMRNPQLWMPLELVVEQLSKNVSCLIQYYLSAGNHSAQLPDFLTNGCLTKTKTGEIEYDFGEHAYISDLQSLLTIPREELLLKMNANKKTVKRKLTTTPQKGRRRKVKSQASTPK